MSWVLDRSATATVRAATPVEVRVIEDPDTFLNDNPGAAVAVLRMTAMRLDGLTQYLVDVKQQFAGLTGHLGMVDQILDSLVHHQSGPHKDRFRARPGVLSSPPSPSVEADRLRLEDAVPVGGPLARVERDVRRDRADLLAGVEHPGPAEPGIPRATGTHGAWWMCPQNTTSGWYCSIQAARSWSGNSRRPSLHRGVPAGGAWYSQIHVAGRSTAAAASCAPTSSRVTGPSHHGQIVKRTPSTSMLAPSVCTPSSVTRRSQPATCSPCAPGPSRSWFPDEARTRASLGERRQVLAQHDGLDIDRHRVDHVGEVAAQRDDVGVAGGAHEPVVVGEPVVQVRHGQDAHGLSLP